VKSCTVVLKAALDALPPVISAAAALGSAIGQVTVLTARCAPQTRAHLEGKGVKILEIGPREPIPSNLPGKILWYARFRRKAWRAINRQDEDTLLWIGSADTAIALGRTLQKKRYVLHCHELYDAEPITRYLLKPYFMAAQCAVVPEPCRAAILRCWYGLDSTPVVIPNKPLSHPRRRNLPISDARARTVIAGIPPGSKILCYSGHIDPRRYLMRILGALAGLSQPYVTVLMGLEIDHSLQRLQALSPGLRHIPFVPPPAHLEVISHCHIGLAVYSFRCLNEVFCAPNKIFEYAGFGIPVLYQNLPGLEYTVGTSCSGVSYEANDPDSICSGVLALDRGYDEYSKRATSWYDQVDIEERVREVLQRVGIGGRGSPRVDRALETPANCQA
jgi:hypothetical protein